jgi:hypothetical protein
MATFISNHCQYFKFFVWDTNVKEKLNHVQQNKPDVCSTLGYLRADSSKQIQ